MPKAIGEQARAVLSRAIVLKAGVVVLDDRDKVLDKKVYREVATALETLGAKWTRGVQGFVYPPMIEGMAGLISDVADSGTFEPLTSGDYFPTPEPVARAAVLAADVREGHRILEPSAGDGALVRAIMLHLDEQGVDYDLCAVERRLDLFNRLNCLAIGAHMGDFLEYEPSQPFDRVVMNPPFSKGQAVLHVRHAMTLLRPGGRLVAILPSSIRFRQDPRHAELRAMFEEYGSIEDLPRGSFKVSGTMVNTCLAVYDKPGRRARTWTRGA